MTILQILTYPDKFLKKTVAPVEIIDDKILQIIDDMAETMYAAPGSGLAAIQVGIDKRIIIYDISNPEEEKRTLTVLINPEIIDSNGETVSENEGCLSVPDFRADVKRAASVHVRALNQQCEPIEIETDTFEAIVLQHEIDHLNGILFIDRISSLKRGIYKKRVRKRLKGK